MDSVIDQTVGENFVLYNGDCVEVVGALPDASVGYTIYSPPFASLYTYSASERDMGNCRDHEVFRTFYGPSCCVTKPAASCRSSACSCPPARRGTATSDCATFEATSSARSRRWDSSITAKWSSGRTPLTAMPRTEDAGCSTSRSDSCASRGHRRDYLITMRSRARTWSRSTHRRDAGWTWRLPWTPPGGMVLEPFAGSGTTPAACALEDVDCLAMELDADYVEIARARVAHAVQQREEELAAKIESSRQMDLFAMEACS